LLVAIIRSAVKNLRKLDKEERAKWDNQEKENKTDQKDWT
jgi:hypothetical protein